MSNNHPSHHLRSCVQPCGNSRWFELHAEPMNHRELRAMWRQLRKFAEANEKLLTTMIEEEDAVSYSI